jgi:hypothetical protein
MLRSRSGCCQTQGAGECTSLNGSLNGSVPDNVQEHSHKQSQAYPFSIIEQKWQRTWEEKETFKTPHDVDMTKPKHYVLDMFPYPRFASFP